MAKGDVQHATYDQAQAQAHAQAQAQLQLQAQCHSVPGLPVTYRNDILLL